MGNVEYKKCESCGGFLSKEGVCLRCIEKKIIPDTTVTIQTGGCSLDIHVKDDKEAEFVKKISKDYEEIDFEVPDAGAQLENLLTLRLESKRIQKALAETNRKNSEDRKALTEQLNKNQVSIQKTQDTLGITREKLQERASSPVQIFGDTAEQLAQFRIENKHIFRGIAKCDKCNDIIIFEGVLPTFEAWFTEELKRIVAKLEEEKTLDVQTLLSGIDILFKEHKSVDIYKEKYRKYIMKKFD